MIKADDLLKDFGIRVIDPEPKQGGQKTVFKAEIDGIEYAIKFVLIGDEKTLLAHASDDEEKTKILEDISASSLSRLWREIRVLRDCPGTLMPKLGPIEPRTYQKDGRIYAVYAEEYIEGDTLESIISREGGIDETEALKLCRDLCISVAEIWQIQHVHRDIKPSNIIKRASDGRYILLDPGIALDLNGVSLTGGGFSPHTPGYIAPEMCVPEFKKQTDSRSDLFLVGIVVFFATTGQHPFITEKYLLPQKIIQNICQNEPQDLKELKQTLSPQFCALVTRLLNKHPHARYRNPNMLMKIVAELLRSEGA
jgi:serine/threonine protein kinase